jgi:hypothetical protein
LRSAYRIGQPAGYRGDLGIGFRVAAAPASLDA